MKSIVITGGACSGKSELIEAAAVHATLRGYASYIVPETATELISGAHLSPTDDRYSFQRAIFRLQLAKEEIIRQAAGGCCELWGRDRDREAVLLLDRGLPDGRAYMPPAEWQRLLAELGFSEAELMSRYDGVICLQTVAKLDPAAFSNAGNSARYESALAAVDLDTRTCRAWSDHPRFTFIEACPLFSDKKDRFLASLDLMLDGAPLCAGAGCPDRPAAMEGIYA